MSKCLRCGRELIDPNAKYGWRCAQKVGVPYGNSDSILKKFPELEKQYNFLSASSKKKFDEYFDEMEEKNSYVNTAMEGAGMYILVADELEKHYNEEVARKVWAREDTSGQNKVPLRQYIESRGGTVTPNYNYNIFGKPTTLKSIAVNLNGYSTTYTDRDYKISNGVASINDEILFNNHSIINPSDKLKDFVKGWEKPSLTRYDALPGKGDWTIGWGHKLKKGEPTSITPEQAETLFEQDTTKMVWTSFQEFLKKNKILLSQQQFDAMVSFTFNFGENTWGSKGYGTIQDFLKAGDYSEVATRKAFSVYMGSKQPLGLIKRRTAEINMFLYDIYDNSH